MRRAGILALLSLVVASFAAGGVAEARSLYLGISANTRTRLAPEQEIAAETGVKRLREDLEWWRVEPVNDEWVWTETDAMYKTAAELGLSILPITNVPPCWAVGKLEHCDETYPQSNAEYAEFVAHATERYGPGGDFWEEHPGLDPNLASRYFEIWNEPYLGQSVSGDVNPAHYAALYKAAVIAGRVANPAARFLVESTYEAKVQDVPIVWVNWARKMWESDNSIGSYIDGIAVHPYPESQEPSYTPTGPEAAFKNARRNYDRWREPPMSINRPVWITEVGYSSCADTSRCVPGATQTQREETKASWLAKLLNLLGTDEYAFVHAAYLYNLRQTTPATEPNKNFSNWLGIIDKDGNHLPAWNSFAAAVESYDGIPVPRTAIVGHETSSTINGESGKFTFQVTDPTATSECQLDGNSWASCASPKTYSGIVPGSHSFHVRSSNAEAQEAEPATYSWITLPTVSAVSTSNYGKSGLAFVTLGGTVNPKGSSTTYQFEWGLTTAYGSVAPAVPSSVGSGTSDVSVSQKISFLANTQYHVRMMASSVAGTVYGPDRTFRK